MSVLRRIVFPLALAAAGLYGLTGAIELTHDQPAIFADAIDYWIEGFFVAALVLSVTVFAMLASASASRPFASLGWALAAAGHAGMLVAALATALDGREQLDALFVIGFLILVAGYMLLAALDLRRRLVPARAGLVLLAGFVGTAVVDNLATGAGGLVLAAVWAALARLFATSETSTAHPRAATAKGVS